MRQWILLASLRGWNFTYICFYSLFRCNENCGDSFGRFTARLEPGRWYRIGQQVKLNDLDEDNGRFHLYVDGQVQSELHEVKLCFLLALYCHYDFQTEAQTE